MKRYIRANKHIEQSSKRINQIAITARALADAIESTSEEELRAALSEQGRFIQKLPKDEAVNALFDQLDYLMEDYESEVAKGQEYPVVQADLVNFLKNKGYLMQKMNNKPEWGYEGWIIIPADEYEFKDLNKVCKEISDYFGNKWDTPLSGSWTGHGSSINGINFHVSIQRDYEYDPSGKSSSLQLYF